MAKNFKIPESEIENVLLDWDEADGCMATDRITVDGERIGYMYREQPDIDTDFGKVDSGWRFFAGDESDEYANDPGNLEIYKLNEICNYDKDIIPFLKAPYGSAFARNEDGVFEEETFKPVEE